MVIDETTIDVVVKREFDPTIELADNAMLKHRPDLFDEWDFEKNDELGLDVYKVTYGSGKRSHWVCKKESKHRWETAIYCRAGKSKKGTNDCPYCNGNIATDKNLLTTKNPFLAAQWHPILNKDQIIDSIAVNSNRKVWWLGECGHEWEATVVSRNAKSAGCPYCSGKEALKGFNDMWTTNPDKARLLADAEDGYRLMQTSGKSVDWRCSSCKGIVKNKPIYTIKGKTLYCKGCADGVSYSEKIIYHLLRQVDINFDFDTPLVWSKKKRYDFYLSDYNIIVEVNGLQHYERGFKDLGGRTLEEEIKNDVLKKEMARNNNISHYVTIDARISEFDYIKKNIESSNLLELLDLTPSCINWSKIQINSERSLMRTVCEMWNNGARITTWIARDVKLSLGTVISYLKRGAELGLCDYDKAKTFNNGGMLQRKKIIKLSLSGEFIREFDSLADAARNENVKDSGISKCATGKAKTASGFKWMYAEEYYKEVN